MAARFEYRRRVNFHETDMAGIMHFSNFFRLMEEAEHAFMRSLGRSVHPVDDPGVGWPRVHASCDFKRPLRFEDEVVVEVVVEEVRSKAVRYLFRFWVGTEEVATGRVTAVHVRRGEGGGTAGGATTMKAAAIPETLRAALEVAG